MGLRGVDAEPEPHPLQLARPEHRRLAALEHVDERRAAHLPADDPQFIDCLRRLDEPDIGAGFEIGVDPVDRRLSPSTARASERAMITMSASRRVSTAALILPTISARQMTSLPS